MTVITTNRNLFKEPLINSSARLSVRFVNGFVTVSGRSLFADWQVWGGILGISLISCVLPNVLYMNGLQKLEAGHAVILATVEPVVAAIVSFLFLGEAFSLQKLLGIVLILAAVPVLSRTANKK